MSEPYESILNPDQRKELSWTGRPAKTYIEHFLPRDVIGPVIIVFSLEGVINGLFDLYVPKEYATLSWGVIFLASIWLVARWGTSGEAEASLEEKIEELSEHETSDSPD